MVVETAGLALVLCYVFKDRPYQQVYPAYNVCKMLFIFPI